jgi:hypothetical protein
VLLAVEGACGVWLALPGFTGWREFQSYCAHFGKVVRWFHRLQLGGFMKTLLAMVVGTVTLWSTGVSFAENGNMMNRGAGGGGWMGGSGGTGGSDGIWVPILVVVVVVVVGIVVWIVTQKRK